MNVRHHSKRPNERDTQLSVRVATALVLLLGLNMSLGCDDALDPNSDDPCEAMCADRGFSAIDENSTEDGTFICHCQGGGSPLTEEACLDYCSVLGGDVNNATLESNTCTCPGVEIGE